MQVNPYRRCISRLILLTCAAFVGLVGIASAAPTISFSGEVPAVNAAFSSPPTGIRLNATGTAPILKTGATTLVDGVPQRTTLVYPWGPAGHWQYTLLYDEETDEDYWDAVWVLDQDLTKAQVFVSGLTPSTDGTHTISVTLRTKTAPTTDVWQYGVRIAPKLGNPSPSAGSIATTLAPVITIPATDNSAVTTWTVSVNGVPASATLSGGLLRVTPATPLENDTVATVSVSVADALGLRTEREWSFTVQIYPEMSAGVYGNCQTCHVNYTNTHNKADNCDSCHGEYHGATPTEIHTAADVSACKPCHVGSLSVEHSRRLLTCASCHASGVAAVRAAIAAGDSSCSACHTGSSGHEAVHVMTVTPACAGTGCHAGTSLTGIHINAGTQLSCESCHKSTAPGVVAAITGRDKSCTACHDGATVHGDLTQAHTATMSSSGMTILGKDYGTHACSECHATAVVTSIHADCTTCHPSPQDTVVPWNKNCAAGGCHTVGASKQHAQLDSAHTVGTQSCTGYGCHRGEGNLAEIHAIEGCATCHAVGKTPTANCTAGGCHASMDGHGDVTAIHASSITADSILFFDSGASHTAFDAGYEVWVDAECALCHASTNLVTIHARDCTVCHLSPSAPANSITTWSKGCSQASCHPSYHDDASPGHDGEYGSGYCDSCHNYAGWGTGWSQSVVPEWCGSCHATGADVAGPTITSDVKASYVGTASVAFTMTDDRRAKSAYYRLDGGATQTAVGGKVEVAPPMSGTQAHTLEYWAVDWSGNSSVHQNAAFSVSPDILPPTTTSNAVGSYNGPATVRLTAIDNGTSFGVKTTHYRLDGGPVLTGTTVLVAQPGSGTEAHTLDYWSVDYAGNTEAQQSAAFTITADKVAPTTTTNLLPRTTFFYAGRALGGVISATYTPTDPDPSSGVAGVRVTSASSNVRFYDYNEAQWNGTAWALRMWCYAEGNYPISFQARDNAGNLEATQTVIIAYDYNFPVTASNALNSYVGTATITLTPTDSMSGVATTYYKDGFAGTVYEGKTAVIVPPALGSTTHTLYWWSVDKAGNTEAMKTKVFTVAKP